MEDKNSYFLKCQRFSFTRSRQQNLILLEENWTDQSLINNISKTKIMILEPKFQVNFWRNQITACHRV